MDFAAEEAPSCLILALHDDGDSSTRRRFNWRLETPDSEHLVSMLPFSVTNGASGTQGAVGGAVIFVWLCAAQELRSSSRPYASLVHLGRCNRSSRCWGTRIGPRPFRPPLYAAVPICRLQCALLLGLCLPALCWIPAPPLRKSWSPWCVPAQIAAQHWLLLTMQQAPGGGGGGSYSQISVRAAGW